MGRTGCLFAGAVLFSLACRSAKPVRDSQLVDAGVVRLGTPVAEPDAGEQPVPLPPDLDVAELERYLRCPSRGTPNACRILHAFGEATRKVGQVPSGDGRWIGMGYRVAQGRETLEPQMLAVTNVASSTVAPTDLPVRVAMDPVPQERGKEGRKVARSLSHGDSLPSKSKTIAYLKAWSSGNARIAMDTTGPSLRLIAEDATFLRQGNGSVLVVRQRTAPPGAPPPGGDGLYVELWPVKW